MDFVSLLTLCIAVAALGLIVNLFVSLRQTDKQIEEIVQSKEIITEQPKSKKVEKSKKPKKDAKPAEFKHKTLHVNLKGHTRAAQSGVFSSNGKFVASCDSEQSILLWVTKDFNKGNTHVRINTEYDPILSVSFSPDSKALVAALEKTNSTRVYKIAKEKNYQLNEIVKVADLNPSAGLIQAKIGVQLSSGIQSGAFLFHEYHDSTVVLTDLRGIELGRIKCGGGDKRQINLSSCGRYIAVCGDSPELRAWHVNFKSGKFVDIHRLPSLIGHKPRIVKFAFSPDSTRLVTLDNQEMIKVWEMNDWANQQTPRELFEFKNPFGLPSIMSISPDNLTMAMAHYNKLTTFDISNVKTFNIIENVFSSSIVKIDYEPSSDFIAVTGDKVVRILQNLTGWRARLADNEKRLQLASSETHRNGLMKEIDLAKDKILLLE